MEKEVASLKVIKVLKHQHQQLWNLFFNSVQVCFG